MMQRRTLLTLLPGLVIPARAQYLEGKGEVPFVPTPDEVIEAMLKLAEVSAGDTVYGSNSTADRDVFDFTINDTPIVTIWDGGGNDTLDVSGFNSDQVIDLNEGAFSSVGYAINAELHAKLSALGWTQADFQLLTSKQGLAQAEPDKVCQLVQDFFGAQLDMPDAEVQMRLLVDSLRPVFAG